MLHPRASQPLRLTVSLTSVRLTCCLTGVSPTQSTVLSGLSPPEFYHNPDPPRLKCSPLHNELPQLNYHILNAWQVYNGIADANKTHPLSALLVACSSTAKEVPPLTPAPLTLPDSVVEADR